MPAIDRQTLYVTNAQQVEIREPKGGRAYLCIENHDAARVLFSEGSPVDANTATELEAKGSNYSVREWGFAGDGPNDGVPQGSIWILGTQAGAQKVTIKQSPSRAKA